jgi:hypothetical protein
MFESEYNFMSYFFNALGNWLFTTLGIISIWYLFDATNVEFKKIPIKVGLIIGIPNIIQFGYSLAMNVNIKTMLISGYITILISIIIYIITLLMVKKNEK